MDHDHDHEEGEEGCPMIMTVNMQSNKYLNIFVWNYACPQFHVGNCESILFKKFTVKNVEEFAFAVVVIFLISIGYEGLKFWREKLYSDYASETATVCSSIKASTSELTSDDNKQNVNKKSIRYVAVNGIDLFAFLISFSLVFSV